MLKTASIAAMALAGLAAPALAADPPPAGSRDFGGISIDYYCKVTYGQNFKAYVAGSLPNDWACMPVVHHAGARIEPVNFNAACDLQYGHPALYAYASGDAYSWQCYQSPGHIHPLVAGSPSGRSPVGRPAGHRPF